MKKIYGIICTMMIVEGTAWGSSEEMDPYPHRLLKQHQEENDRRVGEYLATVCKDVDMSRPSVTYEYLQSLRMNLIQYDSLSKPRKDLLNRCLDIYRLYLSDTPYSSFAHIQLLNLTSPPIERTPSRYKTWKEIPEEFPTKVWQPLKPSPISPSSKPWGGRAMSVEAQKRA